MTETFRTQSYEERASTKLGVGDYLQKHVLSVLLPIVGLAAGFGLRKLVKNDWLNAPWGAWGIKAKDIPTDTFAIRNAEGWGLKIGGAWGIYNLWKDRSKSQMGISGIQQELRQLKEYESANSYLERENEELRQQISFVDKYASEHGKGHKPTRAEQVRESQTVMETEAAR